MSRASRAGLTYGAAFLGGVLLFFLNFAAIFNGSWALLALFLACYAAAGAAGVRAGRVAPTPLTLALICHGCSGFSRLLYPRRVCCARCSGRGWCC
jgi:succinate dehydrogenase/fumarate reductase cytochrome b subunit